MRRCCLLFVLLASGCDVLFPELYGSAPDASVAGDGGGATEGGTPTTPHVAGVVCTLADPRVYTVCTPATNGSFRITDEENRDSTNADPTASFTLETNTALATATLAAVDARGGFATTVTVVHPVDGILDKLAMPVLPVETLTQLGNQNGFALDPTRGALFAWAVDPSGTPVAGVRASAPAGAIGPLYDGPSGGEIDAGNATGAHGLIALFDLTPGTATLQLTAPSTATVKGDTFTLPIRANAVTIIALTLPANQ